VATARCRRAVPNHRTPEPTTRDTADGSLQALIHDHRPIPPPWPGQCFIAPHAPLSAEPLRESATWSPSGSRTPQPRARLRRPPDDRAFPFDAVSRSRSQSRTVRATQSATPFQQPRPAVLRERRKTVGLPSRTTTPAGEGALRHEGQQSHYRLEVQAPLSTPRSLIAAARMSGAEDRRPRWTCVSSPRLTARPASALT